MSSLAFDTHRAVKALREAGAEAFVETIGGNVATKADISASEAALRAEVANVRAELKTDIGLVRAEIGDLEGRLYRQLWIMAAGIVGLVKLLG